ncbi:unnamed protein product [Clonostachys rhizophaga]|uniref:SUN domain-containing protein n=1 Tax=Clonostachys rhizophaga TaxID=160324 RepID=A0A9N9YR56_9HYPO|nr:unnamed protein product [Clonostachys rhizophaga]
MPRRRAAKAFTGADFSTDDEDTAIPALEKPNLPKLRGTPSSRRQYTYGSDAEPQASPRYRHDGPVDLSNAVKGVLNRQHEDDQRSARARMPPPPPPKPAVDDGDQTDELAADHVRPAAEPKEQDKQRRAASKGSRSYLHSEDTAPPQRKGITSALEQKTQVTDPTDDLRSFGTESDYFVDATIVSSPGNLPPIGNFSKSVNRQSQSLLPGRLQGAPQLSSSEESEVQPAREPLTRNRISKALSTSEKLKPQASATGSLRRSPRKSRLGAEVTSQPQEAETQQEDIITKGKALLGLRKSRVTFANGHAREQQFASHHSEQDDAIQQEIEASEARSQSAAAPSPWRDRWMKVQQFSPFSARARRAPAEDSQTDEDEQEEEPEAPRDFLLPGEAGIDWARILNPEPYLRPIFKLLDSILDALAVILSTIKRYITRIAGHRNSSGASLVFFVLVMVFSAIFVPWEALLARGGGLKMSPTSWNVGESLDSIGGYIRSIPLPSWRKDKSGLWDLGEGLHEVEDYLRHYQKEFDSVKKTGLLHGDAIKKLQNIVPSVVHMELRDGKPVVSEAFWHAIRDLVRGDENVLTIGKDTDGVPHIKSDRRWRAIAAKLTTDPVFQSKLNLSLKGVEDAIDKKMTSHWDGWIKENDKRVLRVVDPLLKNLPTPPSDIELDARIQQVVQKHLGSRQPTQEGVVVSKEEFLRHLKSEFANHRSEIRSELDDLRPRLEQLVKDTVAAANDVQPAPDTMTREEITTLVHGLLRNALSEASLEALANGKIHAHFEVELKNEVNHFAQGAGATINTGLSSKTYDPMGRGVTRDYSRGVRGPLAYPHVAALDTWFEEGDCWCAARDVNHRGNPHGVTLAIQLGRRVIPQHFVIDHILPGATTEPGARPREIEIYADIEESTIRERVRDFSATHFPDPTDWNSHQANLPASFVKIGRFVYEGAELHDGTQLYRLSEELVHLGAATDQVAVRAISNYGAPNHTCFYRLRLFGQQVDD